MNNIKLEERLDRIERLLVGNKTVLTFDEACDYTGISRSYLYKLTSSGGIDGVSKPNGKLIFFDKSLLDNWLLKRIKKSTKEIEELALDYSLKSKRKS
ncbi:helix-turn-helix transcriptional regulator [Olleya namhaensis]|uniref:Transcriptional regulator, AlpA family n=1 Tax=Olleya namhaensis TaxID=1144750 RepID=A0A1I3SUM6_9FLAO|nr:helix-turn-helix domain-containing protein [Olleya namhaensis]SFJ61569.1 transcriptional regulator, AlpA family [Olleya namhaensis]